MRSKTRLLLIGAAILLPFGLGLWVRSVASWRPQQIGSYPGMKFVENTTHEPWLYLEDKAINLDTGTEVVLPTPATSGAYSLSFSPDGRSFAITTDHKTKTGKWVTCVEWHDSTTRKTLQHSDVSYGHWPRYHFSSDSKRLLILWEDGVKIVPLNGSPTVTPLPRMGLGGIKCLSLDGHWVCTDTGGELSRDKQTLKVYEIKNDVTAPPRTLHYERENAGEMAFSPDSSLLCVTGDNGEGALDRGSNLWVYNPKSGAKLWQLDTSYIPTFRFSPDSQTLLVFSDYISSSARMYSARDGRLLRTIELTQVITQMAFSSDGTLIYAIGETEEVWKFRVR